MRTVERSVRPFDPRLERRFWNRIAFTTDGCWIWTGAMLTSGYGRLNDYGRVHYAHRFVFSALVGELPRELDHLCRIRECVNPSHLEAVTHRENVMRGVGPAARNSKKTHCMRGHALTGTNLIIVNTKWRRLPSRKCRQCKNDWMNAYNARLRESPRLST